MRKRKKVGRWEGEKGKSMGQRHLNSEFGMGKAEKKEGGKVRRERAWGIERSA
jgi:hypothetical protein